MVVTVNDLQKYLILYLKYMEYRIFSQQRADKVFNPNEIFSLEFKKQKFHTVSLTYLKL